MATASEEEVVWGWGGHRGSHFVRWQIKAMTGFVEREREESICAALLFACMYLPGSRHRPHTSYHTSLFLLQRALQSKRCVFEVRVGGEEGPSCRQKAGMHHSDTSDLCRHWPLSGSGNDPHLFHI